VQINEISWSARKDDITCEVDHSRMSRF
jgi:hypothetical protein